MAECQWSEKHLLGHFPLSSDGFIFKRYVNVITSTEKVLSRSLRRRYSLSWAMKPFALEAHELWHEHLISFLSCQKQFLDGWSLPLSPPVYFCDSVSLYSFYYVLRLTVSYCQTFLWIKLCCFCRFICFLLCFSPHLSSLATFIYFILYPSYLFYLMISLNSVRSRYCIIWFIPALYISRKV